MEGKYKNRYEVTILINGLPLVQIELKRRGLELKEAFNQTNRYERHSYWAGHGLFQFIQIFVISNGVNTKYYANDIKKFFTACQMFGFTGTPIFEKNAGTNEFGKRTTAMLFGGEKPLHKYLITDAIRDENVLKFSVEYISTFKKKEHILDIDVEAIEYALRR
jgi:type I site-specific restriction-modification system R (restriction) subunit